MANLVQWITETAAGEPIEAVVIGALNGYSDDSDEPVPKDKRCVVLTWDEARPLLDYEFHDGFGGAECNPVEVYTPTRVLFVHEHDGSTCMVWVPRNPQATEPQHGGR